MKNNIIVAVVGLCGSGKSEVTKVFLDNNFKRVYLGEVTFDELKRKNLPVTPDNERMVRENLRATNDMAIYAKLSNDKIKTLFDAGENVVVESMYSWSEYKYFKEIYGENFKVLSIVVDKDKRVERLGKRTYRPLTPQEVEKRDYTEIENIEKGGPIVIADHFILNNKTMDKLVEKTQKYIDKLINK